MNSLTGDGPKRSGWPAVLFAGVILAAGFGALNVFAALTPNPHQLRGLYGYLSATIGDGVLLPVAGYALARAVQLTSTRRRSRPPMVIGATVGATAGAVTQGVWLIDPNPQLNWTLQTPGAFNAAGWYHAAFLVALSAAFGTLIARLAENLWTSRSRIRQITRPLVVLAVSSVSFGILLVIDNLDALDTSASLVTVVTALVISISLLALAGMLALHGRN